MVATTLAYINYLDEKNIKYTYKRLDNSELVSLGYEGENVKNMSLMFFFDLDGKSVSIKCYSIYKYESNELAKGIIHANTLNNKYRWVRFFIDSDNEAGVAADEIITESTAAPICYELLMRMLDIIDNAYLVFADKE